MNKTLVTGLLAIACVLPLSVSALVTCRDTTNGCTLEQNLSLIAQANAYWGNDQTELLEVLKQTVLQLTAKMAQLQTGQANTSQCLDLNNALVMGSTDSATSGEVSKLQQFLIHQGVFPEASVTGYYGNLTAQAVVRWQKAHGMDYVTLTSGVGPTTRSKMKCVYSASSSVEKMSWHIEAANPGAIDGSGYPNLEQAIFVDITRADKSTKRYSVGKAHGCSATNVPAASEFGRINCYYAASEVSFVAYSQSGRFIVERHMASGRDGSITKTTALTI